MSGRTVSYKLDGENHNEDIWVYAWINTVRKQGSIAVISISWGKFQLSFLDLLVRKNDNSWNDCVFSPLGRISITEPTYWVYFNP